jgi:hypothetical protein
MFAFPIGRAAKAARLGLAFPIAAAALLSAGCANTKASYSSAGVPAAYVAQGPSMPVESDGLPVQAPPSSIIRQMPDDPAQPYSRNYGGANPASTVPSRPTIKASNEVMPARDTIPADLPPAFRRQLAAALDAAG